MESHLKGYFFPPSNQYIYIGPKLVQFVNAATTALSWGHLLYALPAHCVMLALVYRVPIGYLDGVVDEWVLDQMRTPQFVAVLVQTVRPTLTWKSLNDWRSNVKFPHCTSGRQSGLGTTLELHFVFTITVGLLLVFK